MGKIIHMVSGPRNMSTAIMYAFDNRKDTLGVDEPFYSYYLNKYPDVQHPGRNDILQSQSTDANTVINQLHQIFIIRMVLMFLIAYIDNEEL